MKKLFFLLVAALSGQTLSSSAFASEEIIIKENKEDNTKYVFMIMNNEGPNASFEDGIKIENSLTVEKTDKGIQISNFNLDSKGKKYKVLEQQKNFVIEKSNS